MKKFTIVSLMFLGLSAVLFAQNAPIDFEDSGIGASWAWTTDQNGSNPALSFVANPSKADPNISDMVAMFTAEDEGMNWALCYSNGVGEFTVSAETNLLKLMVYKSVISNVGLKFEGEGDVEQEIQVANTKIGEWEELEFDFTASNGVTFNRIVIIPDFADRTSDNVIYFDNISFSASAVPALSLPIDFEGGPYNFQDFDGGAATVITNPQSSGINTSATVVQIVRDGGATWAGSKVVISEKLDFSENSGISMKVFTTAPVGTTVKFKLEGSAQTEVDAVTTVSGAWETLVWDFTGQPAATFNTLVFMFDFGNIGNGTSNSTFLFDDVEQFDISGGLSTIDLPVDFQSETVNYEVTDFGGNATVIGEDPTDANNMVGITTKTTNAATSAGTTIGKATGFASRVPLSTESAKMSVDVYSPTAGIQVRLKGEDHRDVTLTVETEATTTKANSWETLVFDFSNVAAGTNPFNPATSFDKFSIFFNFGVEGTDKVYYWDNLKFGVSTALHSIEKEAIKVYSSNNLLHVNVSNDLLNGHIDIYDLTGRIIATQLITSQNEDLDVNRSGIFIIRVKDSSNRQSVARKIIIK